MSCQNFKPGVYVHHKGGTYRALFLAKNSTNGQVEGVPLVIYVCLSPPPGHPVQPGQICARLLEQWNESVGMRTDNTGCNGDGAVVYTPRFEFLHD